jgi:hypothetical protein
MKTITYNGIKYNVAFVTADEVIVNLPERLIVGHQSRMPIPLDSFLNRIKKLARKDLTSQQY